LAAFEGVSRPGPGGSGFDLTIGDWSMRGADGRDQLVAEMDEYAISLALTSEKPPALHDGDGYIVYGDGSASYYYSRTRLAVAGTLTVAGVIHAVSGEAWMDHQWGDFRTYEGSGWDWFSLQLDDGTDVMLYLIRDPAGDVVQVDGSLVGADGTLTVLGTDEFVVEATGSWTSPRSGATYPSGWRLSLPSERLKLVLTPSLRDQELDTTATTEVIYWEGEVVVEGTRAGGAIAGLGYVELTGYASTAEPTASDE
jgi:predicted secreted hydrolase